MALLKRILPGAPVSSAAARSTVETCYLTKIYYLAKPKSTDKNWETYQGEFNLQIAPLKRKAESHVDERSYWTIFEQPTIVLASRRHALLFSPPRVISVPGDLKALSRRKYLPETLGECCGVLQEVLYDCDVFSTAAESVEVARLPFLAYRMKTYYGNPSWQKERYAAPVPGVASVVAKVFGLLHKGL